MLAREDSLLKGKKHTKPDKGGHLANSWWYLSLFSEQRIQSNMQHINCLALRPGSKTVSSVLLRSRAGMLGTLSFPVVHHSIRSTAEYGDATSLWNSERRLVPSPSEPEIMYTGE